MQAKAAVFRLGCLSAALASAVRMMPAQAAGQHDWLQWGGPAPGSRRFASAETVLQPGNVASLTVKWMFTGRGNFTATPTVEGNTLYATDDGGGIYRIDAATGGAVWSHAVSDYTGNGGSVSRSSPAIAGALLIIADRHSGNVIGLDKLSGKLVWETLVETNSSATLTASPTVYGGTVFIGTSSNEEYQVEASPTYVATFRGSVAALDAATGKILWQTPLVPQGYTGGPVWGSGFAISPERKLLYAATGNNYSVPASSSNCQRAAKTAKARLACLAANDYVDSIVALDLTSGTVKWGRRLQGPDTFTLNCVVANPSQPCPVPTGPDYDFASGPNLFTTGGGVAARHLVGAGQKSGLYWALNADTGRTVWSARPGPGGVRGGIMWGSAVDDKQVYVAENNSSHTADTLPGGAATAGGSWAALNAATGVIAWQTPVAGTAPGQPNQPAGTEAAVSVANGVVFGGSTAGDMVALDAATGRILWSFASGGGVTCGPAIAGGSVYWGSGDPYGTPNTKLYAFALSPAALHGH